MWLHKITCDTCGHSEVVESPEEGFAWTPWRSEHGWRGYRHGFTPQDKCPECVAKEQPGCAQEVKGGVWHKLEWGMFSLHTGMRMPDFWDGPHTPRGCRKAIYLEPLNNRTPAWHDVRPGEEPPEGAKRCKRCYPPEK
jgi:hypothetical protein